MGIFATLFGGAEKAYSQDEFPLSEHTIRMLVSESKVNTLDQRNEHAIEHAILVRRHGDGKISLRQIYLVLTDLKMKHLISNEDRAGVMRVFSEYIRHNHPQQ